jgi:putative addiction module component (TIGR02574 family)
MTKTALKRTIHQLPVSDRIDLVDDLLRSIARDQEAIPVPRWQKQMIDERLAWIDENPGKGLSLAQFRRKIRSLQKILTEKARKKASS